jgi:hypothetical protein
VLVEGLSDRIFFEAVLDRFGRADASRSILEVISTGGKGFFDAYTKVLTACQIQYSVVSDLDYIEQVGSPTIKALFKVDSREIKSDVVENTKSLDGDALVGAIEQALETGSWDDAKQIWEYIKSRRRQLRDDLDDAERATLDQFIESKRVKRLYILSQGALEAYLPLGHASKDLDKLIRLVTESGFWDRLPSTGRAELELIAISLLTDTAKKLSALSLESTSELR